MQHPTSHTVQLSNTSVPGAHAALDKQQAVLPETDDGDPAAATHATRCLAFSSVPVALPLPCLQPRSLPLRDKACCFYSCHCMHHTPLPLRLRDWCGCLYQSSAVRAAAPMAGKGAALSPRSQQGMSRWACATAAEPLMASMERLQPWRVLQRRSRGLTGAWCCRSGRLA